MAHKDLPIPQQGGLKGSLPHALVRGEEVQLNIAKQIFGPKVVPSGPSAATPPGSSLSVTDGSTTVTGVTTLTVAGLTVSGTTPNATITDSGGGGGGGGGTTVFEGSNPYNVNPDSHPAVPTGVGFGPNDEFENDSIIDVVGARYTGATPWTIYNAAPTAELVSRGRAKLTSSTGSTNPQGYSQPIVGGTWEYTAKINNNFNSNILGMFAGVGSGAVSLLVLFSQSVFVQHRSNPVTFAANVASVSIGAVATVYLRIQYDGTNLNYLYSLSGYEDEYTQLYTETPAAFLGSVPTLIALAADANGGGVAATLVIDWFRATPSDDFTVVDSALPGNIPDLVWWWESDNILASAGNVIAKLQERTPSVGGLFAAQKLSGVANGVVVSSSPINGLTALTWPSSGTGGDFPIEVPQPFPLGITYCFVGNPQSFAAAQCLFGGESNAIALYLNNPAGAGTLALVNDFIAVIATATTAWTPGTPFQANVTYDPATGNYAFRISSAAAGSGTTTTAVGTTSHINSFGSDQSNINPVHATDFGQLLVYGRPLSGPEIAALEAYNRAKWGVA